MISFLAPIFPHSRKAFEAQFDANEAGLVFRENHIGPVYALTGDRQQQLLAVHDRYAAINRAVFWALLALFLVILPVTKMMFASGFALGPANIIARYLGFLPVAGLVVSAVLARRQLRTRLADFPVLAPALSREAADRAVLRNLSPISLFLAPATLLLVFYLYGPKADFLFGINAIWTFGVVGAFAISTGLAWQKYRLFLNHSPETAA